MWRALFLLWAFIPLLLWGQEGYRSLLWQVTHSEMADTTYLFGTMHTRDARAFQFGPEVSRAFDGSDLVAGELDMEDLKRLDAAVVNTMFLEKGTTLDRLYSKREYREVMAALKAKLGPMAPLCTKIKPFYTIGLLSDAELGSDSAVVLDEWFQVKAQEAGKKVVGLETVTEQMAAVDRIPLKHQASMLLAAVRDDGRNGINTTLEAYLTRDLDALGKVLQESGMDGEVDKAMLKDRNLSMVDRLLKHMVGKSVFVAVGAAHLPGEYGLIERLRRLGFTVVPVAPTP